MPDATGALVLESRNMRRLASSATARVAPPQPSIGSADRRPPRLQRRQAPIRARARCHPTAPPAPRRAMRIGPEYQRMGALALRPTWTWAPAACTRPARRPPGSPRSRRRGPDHEPDPEPGRATGGPPGQPPANFQFHPLGVVAPPQFPCTSHTAAGPFQVSLVRAAVGARAGAASARELVRNG